MKVGYGTKIHPLANVYCSKIGINCTISNFVEIGKDVVVGDFCSIQAFAYIPQGVVIGDNVFVGPHVCFTNCKYPSANRKYYPTDENGEVIGVEDLNFRVMKCFPLKRTIVEDNVVIGANSTIMCGVTIGRDSIIGAGSVILQDVPPSSVIATKVEMIDIKNGLLITKEG